MQDMQIDVTRENHRFQSRFKAMNFMWVGISLLSIVLSSYFAFSNHPGYVHDWHAPAIILLTTLTLSLYSAAIFSSIIFKQGENWPPPFRRAFIYWCCIAFSITLLSLIDANFSYSYFIALGLCFALFPPRIVIVISTITFFFFCLIQGIFLPPFTPDKLGIFGSIGITFLSMTLVSLWIQHLIYERYARNGLLEQLSLRQCGATGGATAARRSGGTGAGAGGAARTHQAGARDARYARTRAGADLDQVGSGRAPAGARPRTQRPRTGIYQRDRPQHHERAARLDCQSALTRVGARTCLPRHQPLRS